MSKVLVKQKFDYADEFDVDGLCIVDQSKWDEEVIKVANHFDSGGETIEMYFGTNEFLEFESLNDFLSGCTVTPLTDSEAETLENQLGTRWYGHTFFPSEYI